MMNEYEYKIYTFVVANNRLVTLLSCTFAYALQVASQDVDTHVMASFNLHARRTVDFGWTAPA